MRPIQNEREVYICFARKHLRPDGPVDLVLQDLQADDVLTTSQIIRSDGPLFNAAILSFSAVFFGTRHKQPKILAEGYSLHGEALARLHNALSDPLRCTRDDVILTVLTITMLEVLLPTGPRNWLKHMQGLERLLELRLPLLGTDCSPKTSGLYKGARVLILFASLRARTPSVLVRPEWKRILRKNCTEEELVQQELYDVLADCSVLISERDSLARQMPDLSQEQFVTRRDELQQKTIALRDYLDAWRKGRNDIQMVTPDQGTENTFEPIAQYKIDMSALTWLLLNTTQIYILRALSSLPRFHLDPEPDTEMSRAEYLAEERSTAQSIARSVPIYLDYKATDPQFTSPVVSWSSSTAWSSLGGDESEHAQRMIQLLNEKNKSRDVIANATWER